MKGCGDASSSFDSSCHSFEVVRDLMMICASSFFEEGVLEGTSARVVS